MKKVLGGILLVVYSIIAISVTVLLLSYNEYNCSEIGDYTVFLVKDDSLEPEYKKGSILLIKRTADKHVQNGDDMFLYKVINSQEYEMVYRKLDSKVQRGNHITYVIDETEAYDNSYFIGKASDTIVIEKWGYLLSLLESKWGYLFCVVIVSLILFLQEVFELAMEIKYGNEQKKKKQYRAEAYDEEDYEDEYYDEEDYEDDYEEEVKPVRRKTQPRRTAPSVEGSAAPKRKPVSTTGTRTRTEGSTAPRRKSSSTTGTKKVSESSTAPKRRTTSTTGAAPKKRTTSTASTSAKTTTRTTKTAKAVKDKANIEEE